MILAAAAVTFAAILVYRQEYTVVVAKVVAKEAVPQWPAEVGHAQEEQVSQANLDLWQQRIEAE